MSKDPSAQPDMHHTSTDPFPPTTPKPFGTIPQPLGTAARPAKSTVPQEDKVKLSKPNLPMPAKRVCPRSDADIQLTMQQTSAAERLAVLLDDIDNGFYANCVPTGFNTLDEKLAGGLRSGLYIVGGASGSGKTALAVSIADHIAAFEQDVLYITLEMPAAELILRSISRIVAQQNNGAGFTSIDLQNGAAIKETRAKNAVNYYAQSIAPHLYYFEGSGSVGTQTIRELTERHISLTERIPVIVIDYLQALASKDILTSDKNSASRTVIELKRLARDFSTQILCLSGLNVSDAFRAVSLASFNEAGDIENACDAVFALQFEGQGQADFDPQSALAAAPRKMQLICLKYRQGPQGWRLPLRYYPAVNLYTDMMNDIPAIAKTNKLKKGARAKLSPGLLPSKFASLFDK